MPLTPKKFIEASVETFLRTGRVRVVRGDLPVAGERWTLDHAERLLAHAMRVALTTKDHTPTIYILKPYPNHEGEFTLLRHP